MKRRRFIFSRWLVGAAISLMACPARGADVAAGKAVAPVVAFSVRSVADRTVEQGEPFSVSVRLAVPRDGQASFALAPAGGGWTSAVYVEIAKDKNAPALARASVVGRPASPAITIEPKRSVGGLWQFSSDSMKGIVPGDYVVRVRLKIDGGAGWTGEVAATPSKLKVVAVSSDPVRAAQSTLGRAQEAMLAGRHEDAAQLIDGLLKKTPKDREALVLRAVLCEKAGNFAAALFCVNLASKGFASNAPPPADLYDLQTRLQAKIFGAAAADPSAAPLPAWSWPPRELYADIEKAALAAAPKPATKPVPVKNESAKSVPAQPVAVTSSASVRPAQVSAPTSAVAARIGEREAGTVVAASELAEANILADPAGQWAVSATAGSQYGKTQYSAMQATGAPNISVQGNSPDAWCPAVRDKGIDWLEVTFAKPVQATELRVRQNDAAGAIVKIEAIEPDGTAHVWWAGVDPHKAGGVREIVWFAVRMPRTSYVVARVKLTLNLASGPGYKEIDAVQLVAAP